MERFRGRTTRVTTIGMLPSVSFFNMLQKLRFLAKSFPLGLNLSAFAEDHGFYPWMNAIEMLRRMSLTQTGG